MAAAARDALLLLFDVDGTLLQGAADAHRDAIHTALREVHGVDATAVRSPIAVAGRTDGEIARAILLSAGISAERIDARADRVREVACRAYARLAPPDLTEAVVDGMPTLLPWLSQREDVTLSLVTGNFEPIARLKLRRAGIGRWFPSGQGGFGSDHEDRAALPGIARRRAGGDRRAHPRKRTIVIGDTPRDIACARADGVRCLAVTTGPYEATDLGGAYAVACSTGELRELLERELG